MVIRRVMSLTLWFVSGCAAVDPAPRGEAKDLSSPNTVALVDLALQPPPPPPVPHDMAMPIVPHDLAMLPPAPPPPPPDLSQLPAPDLGPFPPNAVYTISVKSDGQLMSIHNQSTLNGSATEEQPAHGTLDQRWMLQLADSGYRIINFQSNTCLDVANSSTSDSAATGIYTCSSSLSQQWTLLAAGSGFYNLVNANSKSCIDLDDAGTTPGTPIFQYHCNGGDNQKWLLTQVQ